MRAYAEIFVLICLLLLVGTVTAGDASTISKTSGEWIIANGKDSFDVTVKVQNSTGAVNGAIVSFTVDDPVYGTINPDAVVTGPDGLATRTFVVGTKSGTALITADIRYDDAGIPLTILKTISQKIDHDSLLATFTPSAGRAGEEVLFNVLIADAWGNPIDTLRDRDNTITLSVSCAMPNDCEFTGFGHTYSNRTDPDGNLAVPLYLGTKTGVAAVVMSPVQDIKQQEAYIDIQPGSGVELTAELIPGDTVNVGTGVLNFSYSLADQFGNPVVGQSIFIQTSLDENETKVTNAFGKTPVLTYGPKFSACMVTINATTVGRTPELLNEFTVTFKNAEPTMNLFVSPIVMSSRDYVPPTQAGVTVTIRDDMGNPISGEHVVLTLDFTPDVNWTHNPYLGSDPDAVTFTGISDAEGRVTTVFIPGNLTEGTSWQGTCTLTATWTEEPTVDPKSVDLTWNNHPYVNIYTTVEPETVPVNGIINVTVRVAVNGKTGNQGPLTVVMDQDATSNMGRKSKTNPLLTMEQEAIVASKTFIDKLNPAKTRIGMESFGDATGGTIGRLGIDGTTFSQVHAEYDELYNLKLTGDAQDYYNSILRSEDKILADGHPENVKIIVFLSDGGSVLTEAEKAEIVARATRPELGEQPIRLMTICYTNNALEPSGAAQLRELAASTGGAAYIARNADELAAKFQELIDLINLLCNEGSVMTASFDVVPINKTYIAEGGSAYEYVPFNIPAGLPELEMSAPDPTPDFDARTSIIWPNQSQSIKDQTTEWPDLTFVVGRINLTEPPEEWSTTFSLRVKEVGCYNVFGAGSEVSLGDGYMATPLPDLPICVNATGEAHGITGATLDLSNLHTGGGTYTEFIPLLWDTDYVPAKEGNSVAEILYYSVNGGIEKRFGVLTVDQTGVSHQTAQLDVRGLASGTYEISIRVHAISEEGEEDELVHVETVTIKYNPPYIKLE